MIRRLVCAALPALACSLPLAAHADEPRLSSEPRMMREPGEPVLVADAFAPDDPFDVHIGVSYELSVERSRIARRRASGADEGLADYSRLTSRLVPRLEVGVYRDLSLSLRAPIVLSDTRDLGAASGGGTIVSGGETLVRLPHQAVERSGLENMSLAIDAGILNQMHDAAFPTWTAGFETRLSIGPVMRACVQAPVAGQVSCAHAADLDRDGKHDPNERDYQIPSGAGVTRGTLQLVAKTAISRRIRYIEPYGVLRGRAEIALPGSLFAEVDSDEMLPLRGELELGILFIPWEHRERFSRVLFGTQLLGQLVGRGLDYGQLFDAIGTSDAPQLRAAKVTSSGRNYSTGLTTIETHAIFGGAGMLVWQASELIKLGFDTSVSHAFSHEIAADHPESGNYRSVLGDSGPLIVRNAILVDVRFRGVLMF